MEEIFNKKINTFWMFCLCVLTLWLYVDYWLISRYMMLRKYLFKNNKQELIKKSNILLLVVIVYVFVDLFSYYLFFFKPEEYLQMHKSLIVLGTLLLIFFSWSLINLLNKITEYKFKYNFVIIFFHIFYLNYQINNFKKYNDNSIVML